MNQIKNSFDQATIEKILRSAVYSCLAGLTAALTSYQQSQDLRASILTGVLTALVPLSANAGIQYKKGS